MTSDIQSKEKHKEKKQFYFSLYFLITPFLDLEIFQISQSKFKKDVLINGLKNHAGMCLLY
jgi:hypothetical protein